MTTGYKPLGYKIGEVWGDALMLPEDSPAWWTARHMYKNVFDHVRLMVKLREFESKSPRWTKSLKQIERARSLGLDILLCIDIYNTATGPNDYHAEREWPHGDTIDLVSRILKVVNPKYFQVVNEPYVSKQKRFTTGEYAGIVYDFVRGAIRAGWEGIIIAEQTIESYGKVAEGWEWHVGLNEADPSALVVHWDHGCAEGKHREPRVLHKLDWAQHYLDGLNSNAWAKRNVPKGWRYGVWHDEVSPPGRGMHINSAEGGSVCSVTSQFFKKKRVPWTFLTMGGYNDGFGNESWGMHTDLIDRYGNLSAGAKALYRSAGVELPPHPTDPPVEPPTDPPIPGDQEMKSKKRGFAASIRYVDRLIELHDNGCSYEEMKQDQKLRNAYKAWLKKLDS